MPKNWQEARTWLAGGAGGGLEVQCPRCDRRGSVTPDGVGEYRIEWRDEVHGWVWRDVAVTTAELESPEFGCGHDRRVGTGFVGSAPFVRVVPTKTETKVT
jgi:hypothetical protein